MEPCHCSRMLERIHQGIRRNACILWLHLEFPLHRMDTSSCLFFHGITNNVLSLVVLKRITSRHMRQDLIEHIYFRVRDEVLFQMTLTSLTIY